MTSHHIHTAAASERPGTVPAQAGPTVLRDGSRVLIRQGRGLGTELLARLSDRARRAGIGRFTALVTADNVAMARLLRNMGAELAGRGFGTMDYVLPLAPGRLAASWSGRAVQARAGDAQLVQE